MPLKLIASKGGDLHCIFSFNLPVFHVLLHRTEKKEALLKQKEKEKINEKRKEELKRAEKKDKDKQALSEYEKWLVGVPVLCGQTCLSNSCFVPFLLLSPFCFGLETAWVIPAFPPLQTRLSHGLSFLSVLLKLTGAPELVPVVML